VKDVNLKTILVFSSVIYEKYWLAAKEPYPLAHAQGAQNILKPSRRQE